MLAAAGNIFPDTVDDAAADARKPILITRETIEQFYSYDISELLQMYLNLDVRREGGAGAESDLFFYGGDERQIVVYIDDVRVDDMVGDIRATFRQRLRGNISWQYIPLSQVGWIEIRHGIEATRQGANAVSASVHIYTRRAYTSGSSFGGMVTNQGSYGIEGGYYGNEKDFQIDVALTRHGGISATNVNSVAYNDDIDGASQFTARTGYQGKWTPTLAFDLSVLLQQDVNDYDQGQVSTGWQYGRAAIKTFSDTSRWQQQFHVAGWHKLFQYTDLQQYKLHTAHAEAVWDHRIRIGKRSMLRMDAHFFADGAHQTNVTTGRIGIDKRVMSNSGLNMTWDFPAWRNYITLQTRFDHHNLFGNIATYGVQWGRQIFVPEFYTTVALHSGYSTPTLRDRYFTGESVNGNYVGNKNIGFEKSTQLEASARYQFERDHSVDILLYGTRIESVVDYTGSKKTPTNTERYELSGAQANYQYRESNWQLRLSADQQFAEARRAALPYRPGSKFLAQITRRLGSGYTLVGTGRFVDVRTDINKNTLDPYALFDVALSKLFGREYSAGLELSNLFNMAYETDYGFNMPGRTISIRMRYVPRNR